MEQEANDEENEEVTDDIGSSSHSKKHPDGVFFRNETALRYTSAYDAFVRVAKTVPVFKPFIGGTLAESTSSQHTLLKNRLVFYPAAHDTLPKTNNAKDYEGWLQRYFKIQPDPVTIPYVSGCSNEPSCGQFKLNFENR
ncbi:hypothetical protein BGZ90_006297, partial [Linnemannia elongata]